MKILDTSIFVDLFRGFPRAVAFFESLNISEVSFSAITEAELIAGSECNLIENKRKILLLLALATKIPVDNKVAVTAGDFRRVYNIPFNDAVIAASAFHAKAELLTKNVKHFRRVNEIKVSQPY